METTNLNGKPTSLSMLQRQRFLNAIFGDADLNAPCYCGRKRWTHVYTVVLALKPGGIRHTKQVLAMGQYDSNGMFTPCVIAPNCSDIVLTDSHSI